MRYHLPTTTSGGWSCLLLQHLVVSPDRTSEPSPRPRGYCAPNVFRDEVAVLVSQRRVVGDVADAVAGAPVAGRIGRQVEALRAVHRAELEPLDLVIDPAPEATSDLDE